MLSSDRFERERGPISFSIGSSLFSRRGWAEFKPKSVEVDKLITSLILASDSQRRTFDPEQAVVLTDYPPTACKLARRFLMQSYPLLVLPYGVDLFWEILFSLDQPVSFCHAAQGNPDIDGGWVRASKTIEAMNAEISSDYLRRLLKDWVWPLGDPFLFEEVPGKSRLLELESRVEKAWGKISKNLQKISQDEIAELNKLIMKRSGWGLCALSLNPGGDDFSVQTRTIELEPAGYGLGFGKQIHKELESWLLAVAATDNVELISTIPSLVLNADISRHIGKDIKSHDIQFGWNPVQSLLDVFISRKEVVGVSLAQFPLVSVFYFKRRGE